MYYILDNNNNNSNNNQDALDLSVCSEANQLDGRTLLIA